MDSIIFLVFRRMRLPLILLIVVYSISIIGLVLIPGQDAAGQVWYMDFFHAFYFVSFMATTIGFGEIPFEFTDLQRIWVTFILYATVIVWVYAIGNLLSLIQDRAFQEALKESRFTRRMKLIREPFYLICGYGDIGKVLVEELSEREYRAVVIEKDELKVGLLKLANTSYNIPVLNADAGIPKHLLEAGLKSNYCQAVVALTGNDDVNLKIAISSKSLSPDVKVICRAETVDVERNMVSFGTEHVIDPFATFAIHLSMAITAPCLYLLLDWLNTGRNKDMRDPVYPNVNGLWLICGFGRFGKAIYKRLKEEGLSVVIIEAKPELTGTPQNTTLIKGAGTEANTLKKAGIEQAIGLVAGTNNDTNNLSIIMTAKDLNNKLFIVIRQNESVNTPIIETAQANMVMNSSDILANKIRNLLASPLLERFIGLAYYNDNEWACQVVSRIAGITYKHAPHVWDVVIDEDKAIAITAALNVFKPIKLGHLIKNPNNAKINLPCIPLLLSRGKESVLIPELTTRLRVGDKLLFCGEYSVRRKMEWNLLNSNVLDYILNDQPQVNVNNWLWTKMLKSYYYLHQILPTFIKKLSKVKSFLKKIVRKLINRFR